MGWCLRFLMLLMWTGSQYKSKLVEYRKTSQKAREPDFAEANEQLTLTVWKLPFQFLWNVGASASHKASTNEWLIGIYEVKN